MEWIRCLLFACAPVLTDLRIEAGCHEYDGYVPTVLPSFAVLSDLLRVKPDLRIELDLRDHESVFLDDYVDQLSADFAEVTADVRSGLPVLHAQPLWRLGKLL